LFIISVIILWIGFFPSNWLILLLVYLPKTMAAVLSAIFSPSNAQWLTSHASTLQTSLFFPDIQFYTLSMLTNFLYVARRNSPQPSPSDSTPFFY
jgi:hypothetical protein